MSTTLQYLKDPNQLEISAKLLSADKTEDNLWRTTFDITPFYPQGGGQPSDKGEISTGGKTFTIDSVRKEGEDIFHYFHAEEFPFKPGASFDLKVDRAIREKHNAIHSAGHLLDVAMSRLGYEFPPDKGYHFPDSPYVSYEGIIPPEKRESVKSELNEALSKLISEDHSVSIYTVVGKAEASKHCQFVPDYLDFTEPIRIVEFADGIGCPCAGTHISNTAKLKSVEISKIKAKSGSTRISYQVEI